ncbi:hypothetical protein ACFV4K_17755 [Nocardia sp. NPDC059764]|uniref:hypothetical protein n=1 Tax=Nocardia sp. NPDC059764 TaxID=3346939 RepID=UPI003650FB1D
MPQAVDSASAVQLLSEILGRYGSLEAFLRQLYRELDQPTEEIPRLNLDLPAWMEPLTATAPARGEGPGRHAWRSGERIH